MDAFTWIKSHLGEMNVSGAERALIRSIQSELDMDGLFSRIDDMGALFVPGQRRDLFITSPIDVPGYLLLQRYQDKSYLVSTVIKPEDRGESMTVLSADGQKIGVERDTFDPSLYRTKRTDLKIGTPFKIISDVSEDNGFLRGRYIARYALAFILYSIAETKRVPCLFATQGESRAPVEYNFALREKMKSAILLGLIEDGSDKPAVVVKDGKHFSDDNMCRKAKAAGCTPIVSTDPITKAQLCANAGVKTLTLALPYRKGENGEDIVSLKAIDSLLIALDQLL